MKHVTQLFHTLRYLRMKQIMWKLWYRYRPAPRLSLSTKQAIDIPPQPWVLSVNRPQFAKQHTFDFMGHDANLNYPEHWNNKNAPRLWHYHIHYFHDLNTADESRDTQFWQSCLSKWATANPSSTPDSWDPYPLSLRIVNWIIWHLRVAGLTQNLIDHLHTQCRSLTKQLEWHIDANHLWANAKALVFAGCFFTESQAWYQQGMMLINRELERQWHADGGHIELSPMYHAIMTNDLLELIALHQCYAKPYPAKWSELLKQMLSWAETVTHPDGEYAFFNDCAFDIAPNFAALCGTAKQLQITPYESHNNASGYVRHEDTHYTLIADTAAIGCEYQPGHAHADNLSFELSTNKQRILVNSGTSTYENNKLRHWQRSTAAHNTITVDNKNSSQVWHAFRVAKRARITKRDFKKRLIAATHNGYTRLHDPILHSRQWRFSENHIAITDHIQGKHHHDIDLHCHFHPACQLQRLNNTILVYCDNQHVASLLFSEPAEITIHSSHWYPRFGEAHPNQRIQIHYAKQILPLTIHWDIEIHGA